MLSQKRMLRPSPCVRWRTAMQVISVVTYSSIYIVSAWAENFYVLSVFFRIKNGVKQRSAKQDSRPHNVFTIIGVWVGFTTISIYIRYRPRARLTTAWRYVCYAQSMDLRYPWIVPRKVEIDTLRNKVWICCAFHGFSTRYIAQSMDQADEVLFYFEVTTCTLRSCITSLYSHGLRSYSYFFNH